MPRPRRLTAGAWGLAAIAGATFLVSLAVARWVYPLTSINHDEMMYVFQARLLRTGHLTLPADFEPFRPWASGVRDGRLVMSYNPPWPAVLAVGDAVGSMRLVVAAVSAAAVGSVGMLARSLAGGWRVANLAAALVAASPMFVLQTGTYLSYVFSLLLGTTFAWLLVTGAGSPRLDNAGDPSAQDGAGDPSPQDGVAAAAVASSGSPPRRRSNRRLVAAGLVLGVAFFARPFDAILLAVPFGLTLLWMHRRHLGELVRVVMALALGAVVPVAMAAAYNWHALGSPLRNALTVTSASNRLGFGMRGVFDTELFDYRPAHAVVSVGESSRQLAFWVAGGSITLFLAAMGLVVARKRGPWFAALAGILVVVPLGLALFWSPYSIVRLWPGADHMGPYYHLHLVVPLAIFAALALDWLWGRRGAVSVIKLGVLLLAVTAWLVPGRLELNQEVTDGYERRQQQLAAVDPPAVMLLDDRGDLGFLSGLPSLENDPSLDGDLVVAERTPAGTFAALDRFPDRPLYALRPFIPEGGDIFKPEAVLTRLVATSGTCVAITVEVGAEWADAGGISSTIDGERAPVGLSLPPAHLRPAGAEAPVGARHQVRFVVGHDACSLAPWAPTLTAFPVEVPHGIHQLGLRAELTGPTGRSAMAELRYDIRVEGTTTTVVGPGAVYELFEVADPPIFLPSDNDHAFTEVSVTDGTG